MSATQDRADARSTPDTHVGRFAYDTVEGLWEWDDEMFRILGLRPGSVTPTTEHLLSCQDSALRAQVTECLRRVETAGAPFHVTCRLSAADGVDRWILLVCEPASSTNVLPVRRIIGHCVDLTEDFRHEGVEAARQAVVESARHRATIDQAIGTLMVAYGLDADQAFEMLRWWSQDRNVKVRDLAAGLTEAARRGRAAQPALRATFDRLLHDELPVARLHTP